MASEAQMSQTELVFIVAVRQLSYIDVEVWA